MTDYDFTEIILHTGSTRPVMSKPPALQATRKWVQQVEVAVTECTRPDGSLDTEALADWILNAMEQYGARAAVPVFDMDGHGPQCSHCGAIWPLCGHHLTSEVPDEDTVEGEVVENA